MRLHGRGARRPPETRPFKTRGSGATNRHAHPLWQPIVRFATAHICRSRRSRSRAAFSKRELVRLALFRLLREVGDMRGLGAGIFKAHLSSEGRQCPDKLPASIVFPNAVILWRGGQLPVLHVERRVHLHEKAPAGQRQARPGSFPGT